MPPSTGLHALEKELGGSAPPAIAQLPPQRLEELAGAVREARRRQATALEAASENALNHVPRILRGPIRKALG